ncbi:MAG: hypothetical protein H0S82_01045 [Anaerolineaceae bacterium]|nr:hypothetical protein [Anaerolineaceae bacterium]
MAKMTSKNRKALLIVMLISIFTCACPGMALLIPGVQALVGVLQSGGAGGQEEYTWSLVLSGGVILLAILAIIIPIVLLLIWLLTRTPKDPYDQREPTGASGDDPLPPTR